MVYEYKEQRPRIFTEYGVQCLVRAIRKTDKLLETSGAFMEGAVYDVSADSWLTSALLDYLVEIKEIEKITDERVWLQHRVFIRRR